MQKAVSTGREEWISGLYSLRTPHCYPHHHILGAMIYRPLHPEHRPAEKNPIQQKIFGRVHDEHAESAENEAGAVQTRPVRMKRKLDQNNVPVADVVADAAAGDDGKPTRDFDALGLDSRLLQALTQQRFSKPTQIQAEAVPLALEGKDVLGKCTLWLRLCVRTLTAGV